MKRILKIKLDLEKGVQFSEEKIFTQGDLNTHFLNIILPEELDLTNKTMQINFIKSNKEVIFEIIDTLSQENEIKISNNALDTPGKVLLEIILKKSDAEILTINKLAYFIVTETISGANIEVEPGINTVSFITEKLSQLSESLSKIAVIKTEVNNATTEFNILNNLAIKTKEDLVNKNKIALETTTNLNLLNGSALVTKESLNTLNIQAIQNKKDLEEYIQTEKDKLKGEQGIQGIQGPKGEKGNTGLKGDIGPIGPQGIQGIKGSTGIQGIKGIQGDKGEQGIQGIKGEKGNTGDEGPQGIQGPKGEKGEQGDSLTTGGTIDGNLTVTGEIVVNNKISTPFIILSGYKIEVI